MTVVYVRGAIVFRRTIENWFAQGLWLCVHQLDILATDFIDERVIWHSRKYDKVAPSSVDLF